MAEEKEQVLGELYSIKAGLSLISLAADKTSDLENAMRQTAEARTSVENAIQNKKAQAASTKKALFKDPNGGLSAHFGYFIRLAIGILLGVLVLVVAIKAGDIIVDEITRAVKSVGTETPISAYNAFTNILGDVGLQLAVAAIVFAVALVLVIPGKKLKAKMARDGRFFDRAKWVNQLNAEAAELEAILPERIQAQAEAQSAYDANAGTYISFALDTYDFLLKSCTGYIRECDFENVDLLIYYYYTGRADTIKEALNLVDNEIRFNTLMATLQREFKNICDSIDRGFADLGYQIQAQFSLLGSQLAQQHKQTLSALGEIKSKIGDVGARIAETNDKIAQSKESHDVGNALLNKINTNSRKLAEDVNLMRRRANA